MKRKIFSKLLMGAFLIASVSMFVSCKDYDDDISKNSQEITALKSQLESLKSSLSSELSAAKSELSTAIAKKADASELEKKANASDLDSKANASDLIALEARVAALETQIKAIDECAKKSDLDAVSALLAVLDGDVDKAQETADAAKAQADLQKEALENFQKSVADAGYLTEADKTALNKAIEDLKTQINGITISEDVEAMKKQFQALQDEIVAKVNEQLSVLNLFVSKRLTSIVLKPNFYWEGIEGIEAPFINQTPVFEEKGAYTFKYKLTSAPAGSEEVEVKVEKTMGWKGLAGNRELAKYVFAGPNAAHADFPVWAVNAAGNGLTYDQSDVDNRKVAKIDIAYGARAKYNLNPNIADIDGATIGFFENDAPVYTRAQGLSIKPEVITADVKNDNGLLTVPFKVDYKNVITYFVDWTNSQTDNWEGNAAAANEDWTKFWYLSSNNTARYGRDDADAANDANIYNANLPFVALKIDIPANEEKGIEAYTVNSDWAVVVPALYQIVALADNDPDVELDLGTFTKPAGTHEIRKNHLYETVGYNDNGIQATDANKTTPLWNDVKGYGAIPMPATHGVLYNDSIDLSKYVRTHYNYLTAAQYGKSTYDGVLDDVEKGQLMKDLGLEYRYTIINYYVGAETTSESAHIQQSANNPSVFYPRSVDVDGNTIKDQVATREACDREPLIRVDLVSTKDNDAIIRYGYIKLRIIESETVLNDQEVAIDLSKDLYMNCGDEAKITWSQVENLILAKLGQEGFTKKEFERVYKLDAYGTTSNGYDFMPYIDPTKVSGDTDNPGALYTRTWQAKRYVKKAGTAVPTSTMAIVSAADYVPAIDGAFTTCDDDSVAYWTNTNNHFGEVWYTPHDNSTDGHEWDEQTNVLIWNFYPGDGTDALTSRQVYNATPMVMAKAGNMNNAKYQKLMSVTGTTFKTKGQSQKEVSTVVRFINKQTGRSLWVTLKVPAKNMFFAYGDINRRILDHWYDFKTGYKDMTADTIEVYANVPTPAEVARPALGTFSDAKGVTPFGFKKDLTEYWLEQRVIVDMYNITKFSKFANNDVTFRFRYPKSGENTEEGCNTADLDIDPVASDKDHLNELVWQAKGASGRTWYVGLNAKKDQILAYGYSLPGEAEIIDYRTVAGGPGMAVPICTLTAQGQIHWLGRIEETAAPYLMPNNTLLAENQENVNEPANDILNYIGMYNKSGDSQKDTYLSGQKEKTFAAYVEILVANDACYDPIIGKNYFNVRFLRPINAWAAQTIWKDAPNTTQIYDIWRLLNIRDWRTYAVVLDNQKQKFDDGKITYDGKYVDGEKASVPYSFYNIQNLYIEREEIRSDAYLNASERSPYLSETAIANLRKIDAIPSLTGKNTDGSTKWEYFKIVDSSTSATTAGKTALGKAESTSSTDKIAYTNNGGVLKEFHIFVPIAIEYSHGALKPWTQRVWAVITVDPTVGNE